MKKLAHIPMALVMLSLITCCDAGRGTATPPGPATRRPTEIPLPATDTPRPIPTTPPTGTPAPTDVPTAEVTDTPAVSLDGRVQPIAFTHVNLVPMTEEVVLADYTVLVDGTEISEVGPSDAVSVPEQAVVINGTGAYLMPGLADMHMHTRDNWLSAEWPVCPLNLFLANGVTTIRDFGPGGDTLTYALGWREQISAGEMDGPTIYASGRMLYERSMEYPAGVVQWNHEQGFDFQKIYSYVSEEVLHEAMAAANELGMYTAGHIPFPVGLEGVLAAGMDEIAHIEELDYEFVDFDRSVELRQHEWLPHIIGAALQQYDVSQGFDPESFQSEQGETLVGIIEMLQSAQAPVCTTLVVDEGIIQKLFDPDSFLARPENSYLPQRYLDAFLEGREKHQLQYEGIEDMATFTHALNRVLLVELHRAGVILLLSTDSGSATMGLVPGFSLHDELDILVESGFTPYEALATGTVNAAAVVERMIGEGGFGTIEVGKRADLILVRGNPLESVDHIRVPLGVMAAGKWYPEDVLEQMIGFEE